VTTISHSLQKVDLLLAEIGSARKPDGGGLVRDTRGGKNLPHAGWNLPHGRFRTLMESNESVLNQSFMNLALKLHSIK
jgi:hypothetical protein